MLKATVRKPVSRGSKSWSLLLTLGASLAAAQIAHADFVTDNTAVPDNQCASEQSGISLNCTAADFIVATSSVQAGNFISQCINDGQQHTIDVLLTLQSKQADRYNVGYFVGQEDNNPQSTVASTLFPGNNAKCSVTSFPLMDTDTTTANTSDTTAWYNATPADLTNTCGDYRGSPGMGNPGPISQNTIHGVKVLCDQFDSNHNVIIPYTLVWSQSANHACSGATTVVADNAAKCQGGQSALSNVFVAQNANPTCGKTMTFDGPANQLTAVITITNNDPTTGFNNSADGTTFKDDFSQHLPGLTVTNAQCTNSSGGATCPPPDLSFAGNIVTGTITTFPYLGSIEITVTASITAGDQGSFANSVDLTLPATVAGGGNYVFDPTTGTSTWTGACTTPAQQLPVRLQDFDVK